jgi:hypothetical protein
MALQHRINVVQRRCGAISMVNAVQQHQARACNVVRNYVLRKLVMTAMQSDMPGSGFCVAAAAQPPEALERRGLEARIGMVRPPKASLH